MTREELIRELGFACTYCDGSGARQISEDEWEQCQYCDEIKPKIADFILSREKLLLEKIGKPLRDKASLCLLLTRLRCLGKESKDDLLSIFNAIDDALAIIEKEGSYA